MLELAILGLLKERPMHGYELKKRLTFMLGHFWTVSYGSLYPALKRLEKENSIERAYSVKEKTRTRNVYRITKSGEAVFISRLGEVVTEKEIADTEKFDIRLAFFQYLEPETRLNILEKRRRLLERQVESFKAYRSRNTDEDLYRTGLLRHKADQARSDIRWLDRLIAQEKETIEKRESEATVNLHTEGEGKARRLTAASGA